MGLTAGAKALLWVDLETTGGDETLDEIIEVGAILTDFDFMELGGVDSDRDEDRPYFSRVARPSAAAFDRMMHNDVVRKMHTVNGLLEECQKVYCAPYQVESQMLKWLAHFGFVAEQRERTLIIAGSGVGHFDRKMIRAQMPRLERLLTWPPLDIGVVRRFLGFSNVVLPAPCPHYDPVQMVVSDDEEDMMMCTCGYKYQDHHLRAKTHRALDDIILHLEEARRFKAGIRRAIAASS